MLVMCFYCDKQSLDGNSGLVIGLELNITTIFLEKVKRQNRKQKNRKQMQKHDPGPNFIIFYKEEVSTSWLMFYIKKRKNSHKTIHQS